MLANTKILGLVMMTAMVFTAPMIVRADDGGADKDYSHHEDGAWHHGQKDHMMAKILNLSDDQVKQLKDIHQKQKEDMKGVFEQVKANRQAFDAEIVKATPDMNKINDLQNQFKTIQSQMADNHLNSILAIKKVLTPEQFAGYMALKKERRMMKKFGRNHFGHHCWASKAGDGQRHWGGKVDEDHDSDSR